MERYRQILLFSSSVYFIYKVLENLEMILTKNSAVYKIFYNSYECRVPLYSTISEKEIELLGTYGTDINDIKTPNQCISLLLTINDMVEKMKEGIPIDILDQSYVKEIYNIILDHLDMWWQYGLTCKSRFNPPLEDLSYLDRLASSLFSTFTIDNFNDNREYNVISSMSVTTLDGSSLSTFNKRESTLDKIITIQEHLNAMP